MYRRKSKFPNESFPGEGGGGGVGENYFPEARSCSIKLSSESCYFDDRTFNIYIFILF